MFDSKKAGKQIAILRKKSGMTQEELAQRLGVSPQAVSKWENGHTMPEVSVLVELANELNSAIDSILLPGTFIESDANFEHVLLPYKPIAEFSGKKWPRSMAQPAILSAIKLLMGLEEHMNAHNQQINDDTEYILQSAYSAICFGYSWGLDPYDNECLSVYGLTCEKHSKENYSEEEFVNMAKGNIMQGYPVIVEPKEYKDKILATGFSNNGNTLKGRAFLDGDDDKNSVMSFEQLQNFPAWYRGDMDLIMVKPADAKVTTKEACKIALKQGYQLLSNTVHCFEEPLEGYGLVIYDNWCEELKKEDDKEELECLYPHFFIHYEGKMRIKQFLELCTHIIDDVDKTPIIDAISKYEEIVNMCKKCMPALMQVKPKDLWDAKSKRQHFIRLLQVSKELEIKALNSLSAVIIQMEAGIGK